MTTKTTYHGTGPNKTRLVVRVAKSNQGVKLRMSGKDPYSKFIILDEESLAALTQQLNALAVEVFGNDK